MVLGLVVVCVLFTLFLSTVIPRNPDYQYRVPATPLAFALLPQILAPYGNLVRRTLEWLDSYHLPISRLARTVFNYLMAVLLGGEVSPGDAHSLSETPNHQTRDRVVQMDIQSPPPAHH